MQIPLLRTLGEEYPKLFPEISLTTCIYTSIKLSLFIKQMVLQSLIPQNAGNRSSMVFLEMWTVTTACSQIAWTLFIALGVKIVWWHWTNRKILALARRFQYGNRALPLIEPLIFKGFSNVCKCGLIYQVCTLNTEIRRVSNNYPLSRHHNF